MGKTFPIKYKNKYWNFQFELSNAKSLKIVHLFGKIPKLLFIAQLPPSTLSDLSEHDSNLS
jgi:hypothetical protein